MLDRFLVLVAAVAMIVACDVNITGPRTIPPNGTGVFSGKVYPNGRTRWFVEVLGPSRVTVRLDRVDPPVKVGLLFGALDGTECVATEEVETTVGAEAIEADVAPGQKCIEVFDLGAAPLSGVSVSLTLRAL